MRCDGDWSARELDEHDGAGFGAALERHGAAVVLHDFGDDGEAESGAVGFAGADEWIESGRANCGRDTTALIDNADFESVFVILNLNRDATVAVVSRFAGVENEIEKGTLEFFRIEDAFGSAAGDERNRA